MTQEVRVLRWALGRLVGHHKLDAYLEQLKSCSDYPKEPAER